MSFQITDLLPAKGAGLAPMAGVTDAAMRLLCHRQGAAWAVSEMLSAKGWVFSGGKNRAANDLLARLPGEGVVGLQLFGSEPEYIAEAARQLEGRGFQFFDLNFGCPAPKITGNGEGSAMMREPEKIGAVVQALVDVTSRTREQQYSGRADWSVIRDVKRAVSVPVFGNGDVRCGADALRMMEETGCDAVIVGRAAEGNPWIFREIAAALRGEIAPAPTPEERVDMAMRHFELERQLYGEKLAVLQMRKHIAWYVHGMRGASRFRETVNAIESGEAVLDALREFAASQEE